MRRPPFPQWPPVPRHLPWIEPPAFGELPVGSVTAFAGKLGTPVPDTAKPPDLPQPDGPNRTDAVEAWGWMLCDGRALGCSDYPLLFAALGRQYGGAGDDQTGSFCLPDYRGYVLRAVDNGAGVDPPPTERTLPAGGKGTVDQVGSIQQDALQNHEHGYLAAASSAAGGAGKSAIPGISDTLTDLGPTDVLPPGANGVRVSSETRAKNIYVHYLIKYTYGLGPSFPAFPL
ncbi:phage tail protein [Duganella hordei]|uniref:phage tail protein n=1 Tax=Duganella hordei TaxID=2865934 RepID=UPI0030E9F217